MAVGDTVSNTPRLPSPRVTIPISAKWRRLIIARTRLNAMFLLVPVLDSWAGAWSRQITLRAPRR
jgi:hypothetical protein